MNKIERKLLERKVRTLKEYWNEDFEIDKIFRGIKVASLPKRINKLLGYKGVEREMRIDSLSKRISELLDYKRQPEIKTCSNCIYSYTIDGDSFCSFGHYPANFYGENADRYVDPTGICKGFKRIK